jgi:phosphomevalonate kinase
MNHPVETRGAPASAPPVLRVSAPGKLMLSGEYAVLDGAPAIVAAVDARAVAHLATDDTHAASIPPEVAATWALARERFRALPAEPPTIDVRALRDPTGAQKLGLGSSAAAAAVTAGLALAHAGLPLDIEDTRRALFELAFEGHRVIAPEGSGADVAAAALGGFVRFEAGAREPGTLPTCRALTAPAGLLTRVVWTGHAARTSDLVAQVRQWASREPRAFAACSAALTETAAAFADAFERGQLAELLTLTARYHEGMRGLGEGAGAPIVEARLAEVARLAEQCGGRAKPSGAGGGDVAIGFFTAAEDLASFDRALAAAGFKALALSLGAPGPRLE